MATAVSRRTALPPTVAPVCAPTIGTPAFRRAVVALVFAGVAMFSQLYAPQAVIPRIAEDLAVTPASAALVVSASTIGLAVGVIPWSWVTDRIGPVRTMTVSLGAAAVLGVGVVCAPSLDAVLALRALEGFALAGLPAVAMTYVQAAIAARHTALVAATFIAGTSIGGLLGRMVATPIAAAHGWRFALLVITALAVLMTVAFVVLIPSLPTRPRRPAGHGLRTVAAGLRANLRSPAMLVLFAQGFLLMGAYVAVYNYLAYRLEGPPFSLGPAAATTVLLVYVTGTVWAVYAGRCAARIGRMRVMVGSTAAMATGTVLLMTPSLPLTTAGIGLFTSGFFGAHAIASGWVGDRAPSGTAQATALYTFFYYVGSTLTGWAAGLSFAAYGWHATLLGLLGLIVLAGSLAVGHRLHQGRADPSVGV